MRLGALIGLTRDNKFEMVAMPEVPAARQREIWKDLCKNNGKIELNGKKLELDRAFRMGVERRTQFPTEAELKRRAEFAAATKARAKETKARKEAHLEAVKQAEEIEKNLLKEKLGNKTAPAKLESKGKGKGK